MKIMTETAESLGGITRGLCFDGFICDWGDKSNEETNRPDKIFHTKVEENLLEKMGYRIKILEKNWDEEEVDDSEEEMGDGLTLIADFEDGVAVSSSSQPSL